MGGDRVYPDDPRAHGKKFWHCEPCDAWTATHENSPTAKPIGRLANAELRAARKQALAAFNPLWLAGFAILAAKGASKSYCTGIAYKWLSERMGITQKTCHIGSFTPEQCKQARAICLALGNELMTRFNNELTGTKGI